MIKSKKMIEIATGNCQNALNQDWHRSFKKYGPSKTAIVVGHCGDKTYTYGKATVAVFKWDNPPNSDFLGFIIAALKVSGKIICETTPVHSFNSPVNQRAIDIVTYHLFHHFCPQCKAVDSITCKNGRRGPEWIEQIYSCSKCSYKDYDVMD